MYGLGQNINANAKSSRWYEVSQLCATDIKRSATEFHSFFEAEARLNNI
jgi:hypothetical protein